MLVEVQWVPGWEHRQSIFDDRYNPLVPALRNQTVEHRTVVPWCFETEGQVEIVCMYGVGAAKLQRTLFQEKDANTEATDEIPVEVMVAHFE